MEPAPRKLVNRLDREQREIDEDLPLVEDAHERHEMETGPGTGPVGKRRLPHLDAHG